MLNYSFVENKLSREHLNTSQYALYTLDTYYVYIYKFYSILFLKNLIFPTKEQQKFWNHEVFLSDTEAEWAADMLKWLQVA